ncbi:response regulator [Chryseolinea sp. H1M3-3]|uniref:response regulator n=1 Tax=Chryseolinea sp. H1M3-3 TaxID=3034144 RepID=UPI0023ED474B|nr:response regulator [Chryseolinea sp. H1M3-3]
MDRNTTAGLVPKILLIEDNPEMAENISTILQLAGYHVVHKSNGKSGIDQVKQDPPDLILCDIMMPELDGYGVAHILNSSPDTAYIPFIFLTAKADLSDFRKGMSLGADDYITKPFDDVELLRVIEMRLKKNELLKTTFTKKPQDLQTFFNKARELKEFKKLSENRPVRAFKKKDIIFMEGQIPNDLYFIEQGKIKTYKVNYEGKELITGFYNEGEFLGYVPLLEDKPYNESAVALEDVRVSLVPKTDFLTLIYSSKDVARKFITMLSNNLEEMEKRLLDLAYQSIRQRVASALIKMNENALKLREDAIISVARKDMANIVGTALESLNRTLSDFKDESLIEMSGKGIRVLNQQKLERLLRY